MIKTLRITSIVAAVLAVIFFVFPVIFGVRSDEHIEELLSLPGVIEKFNKAVGNKATRGASRSSPLVQQAGAFALYLNPPKPKVPKGSAGRGTTIPRGPAVTPKFKVVGTSYYKGRPELSLVLIDEPGKGLRWVRQSSKVGHLFIEEIKDGVVVVKDGKGTFELAAEQKPETSLLEGASTVRPKRADISRRIPGTTGSRAALPTSLRPSTPFSGRTGAGITEAGSEIPQPRRTAEEDAEMQELVEKLRQIQRSFKSDKTGSGPSAEEKAAMMEKLITEFKSKSSRLSAEEAKRLGTLGKELQKVWNESNISLPGENKDK